MSVLIKDMKMPKYCLECPFEDSPEFDSYCIAVGNGFIGKWEDLGAYKPDWCPLQDTPTVDEWIPVSEKLPEKDELVLATVWNDVVIAWRNRYGKLESAEDIYEKGDVTAWMPLPEPYMEEVEE